MDEDLEQLTRGKLITEVRKPRAGIGMHAGESAMTYLLLIYAYE